MLGSPQKINLIQRKPNANARRRKGGTGIHEGDNKKKQLECTKGWNKENRTRIHEGGRQGNNGRECRKEITKKYERECTKMERQDANSRRG